MGADVRSMLISRASSKRTRKAEFSEVAPTRWSPTGLRHPRRRGEYFTEDSAWEFIREALREGIDIQVVTLRRPEGKTGYVIQPCGSPPVLRIYIKLQLGGSLVLGRSFHESTLPEDRGSES